MGSIFGCSPVMAWTIVNLSHLRFFDKKDEKNGGEMAESTSSESDVTVVLNAWYSAGFYTHKFYSICLSSTASSCFLFAALCLLIILFITLVTVECLERGISVCKDGASFKKIGKRIRFDSSTCSILDKNRC